MVTALQSSSKKSKRISSSRQDGGESPDGHKSPDFSLGGAGSFENLPALMDEAASKLTARDFFASAEEFFNTPVKKERKKVSSNSLEMDMKEREADRLLESIRKDDLDGSAKSNRVRGRRSPGCNSRRSSEDGSSQDDDDAFAASMAASNAALARHPSNASFDDDEGSMVGDMARLSQSIMNLQHDLENVDFAQLEGIYDDGFGGVGGLDQYDGESGLLARLKLWFSRGMIVEQKLLNTYVNPNENAGDGGAEAPATRYADNPVLVWSLALMWSFVVLILMHPKIAELVEGGDPGQLADIIEWMFG